MRHKNFSLHHMSWGARRLTMFDGTTYHCYTTFMRKLAGNIFFDFFPTALITN